MRAFSLIVAYMAASIIPSSIQLVSAIDWDRPKTDHFAHSPDVVYTDQSLNETFPKFESMFTSGNATLHTRAAKDFYLRIMPLGASITRGQGSTDGNGYRKALRQQLRWKGWKVNMVGSRQDGNMNDSDNEGWAGYVINSVYNEFKKSAHLKPNLVLVNAGTNDCGDNGDGSNTRRDMKAMLDGIFSSIDGVTIILSTLLPKGTNNGCASFVSEQYRSLVQNDFAGRRIGLADINSVLPSSTLIDGTHPTNEGYRLFASVWWDAISKMENVFQPPLDNGQDDSTGTGNTGHNDGNYVHSSQSLGVLESARIEHKDDPDSLNAAIPNRMFFANLIKTDPNAERSQALDDWIRVWHKGDNDIYV
ncbi:SGNH hydrolase-type esterase domain-containing protein [Stachybotrys elegans]|uniref:SGNH hydrolase-type esterase domain-containing protein n=1 Tax=Stachybotrys elegans TaxID=80388 RepID=A0A8K0SRG7_9HYPO|nr:SGNH hydrolase-type esterase domain-containing protein [Stachybotrys elegans]